MCKALDAGLRCGDVLEALRRNACMCEARVFGSAGAALRCTSLGPGRRGYRESYLYEVGQ